MKFSTRQDIKAPIEFVFTRAADFEAHGRQALRRGIEINRADDMTCVGTGMQWNARFPFRGKLRKVQGELTEFDLPNSFLIKSVSGGLEADFDIEFLPLSRNRTRIKVGLDLAPKTLSARLLIQSLKLAKSNLDKRFINRMAKYASEIQDHYDRANGVQF